MHCTFLSITYLSLSPLPSPLHPIVPSSPSHHPIFQASLCVLSPGALLLAPTLTPPILPIIPSSRLLCVYCPLAHSYWHPQGFLKLVGVLDYAGGHVIHISSGKLSSQSNHTTHSQSNISVKTHTQIIDFQSNLPLSLSQISQSTLIPLKSPTPPSQLSSHSNHLPWAHVMLCYVM